ncbi:MAG: C39 family peptidase [Parcubacteria group bacterium]|nr:C39 family peptidase [Parcubacteria group bacterium]
MDDKSSVYLIVFLGLITAGYFFIAKITEDKTEKTPIGYEFDQSETDQSGADFTVGGKPPVIEPRILSPYERSPEGGEAPKTPEKKIADWVLEVPYVNEAPHGIFTGPWKNACEEASISMVEGYYLGKKTVGLKEAEEFMMMLFEKQDLLHGSNSNSDAARTAEMINKFSSYGALIKENPTIEEIKSEINQGRPVLTPNYGFGLKNLNIPFLLSGSSYHMVVVIGYNDETREFITNDSGDGKTGASYRYGYDLFMNTVRDYDYSTNTVTGPSRAIFTFRKAAL